MSEQSKDVIKDAPWLELTYKIIGLAMEIHNELGPGHREGVYHNAMVAKFTQAGINFEDDFLVPVTLDDGTVVGGNKPDLVAEQTIIVELKGRSHLMTKDDQAQVIGYLAGLPHCPVALYQLWPATSRIPSIAPPRKRSRRFSVRSGANHSGMRQRREEKHHCKLNSHHTTPTS